MSAPENQQAAFLAAIRDDPDDDGPRLIFADWLEEQGDPRGEFIRVQCALARLGPEDERWASLKRREWELLEAHWETWVQPLRKLGNPDIEYYRDSVEFDRGLIV